MYGNSGKHVTRKCVVFFFSVLAQHEHHILPPRKRRIRKFLFVRLVETLDKNNTSPMIPNVTKVVPNNSEWHRQKDDAKDHGCRCDASSCVGTRINVSISHLKERGTNQRRMSSRIVVTIRKHGPTHGCHRHKHEPHSVGNRPERRMYTLSIVINCNANPE